MTTNKLIHIPEEVEVPFPKESFKDSLSGIPITRVSNKSYQVEYSTKSPFSCDNSRFLVLAKDHFEMIDTETLDVLYDFGKRVAASSEPLWHRIDPTKFYFHPAESNKLLDNMLNTVRIFSEYQQISGGGESEISWDGDHMVLSGDSRYIFLYNIREDTKSPVLDAGSEWDSAYVSPDNNVLIAWRENGTERFQGEELYDSNMNFIRQVSNNNGHKILTRDVDGSEILVKTNSADRDASPDCPNGIVKIRLSDGQQTCLLPLPWELVVHISAPKDKPFVLVSTFHSSLFQPDWKPFFDEVLKVNLDGGGFERLVHTRSKNSRYEDQPHASINRDGTKFLFNSSWSRQVEVYMVDLSSTVFDYPSWLKRLRRMLNLSMRARFPWWPMEAI